MSEKHTFTLFFHNLSQVLGNKTDGFIEFTDKELAQRIFKILRIKNGESITLFDNAININIEISHTSEQSKNKICGQILRLEQNKPILPQITLMPCILKKEAFEDIIYVAAQMAVTKIVPLISAKIQRNWGNEKETDRLTKIMISACEQSKNFIVPQLCNPTKIQDLSTHLNSLKHSIKAYFDPSGHNFFNLLQEVNQKPDSDAILLFGPEGGLTSEEEKIVTSAGFKTYALTQTILRSREAIITGLGGVRSVAK